MDKTAALKDRSVGVIGWFGGSISKHLKLAALLFDRIACKHVHSQFECEIYSKAPGGKVTLSDLEWLGRNGILVEAPELPGKEMIPLLPGISPEDAELWIHTNRPRIEDALAAFLYPKSPPQDPRQELSPTGFTAKDLYARLAAILLNQQTGADAVPIVSNFWIPTSVGCRLERRANVLKVAFDSVPLPSEATAWEAVSDARADEGTRERLLRLRFWLRRKSASSASVAEIRDELEESLFEYDSYMKLHHRKLGMGRVELLLTTSAEVLEGVLKLRFSTALRALFGLSRLETALLEVEQKAPGRDVAYLSQLREIRR